MPAKKKASKNAPRTRTKSAKSRPAAAPNSQPSFKNALLGLGLVALVAIGIYSYNVYKNSEIETIGLTVCNDQEVCEKSMHIHTEVDVTVCGKPTSLFKETGNLADTHTHKEDDLLHWHDKVKVDKNGNTTGGEEDRKIRSIIDLYLKDNLPQSCTTKGPTGKFKLTVNNTIVEDVENYVWKDGDKLELTYE